MAESVRARLERRNDERLASLDQKRTKKENKTQPNESKDYFVANFLTEKSELESMLDQCERVAEDGEKMSLIQLFDEMAKKCQSLQKFLADSTMFLPSYDVKQSQDTINSFQQNINEKRDRYLPKKKFTFKVRKKQVENTPDGKEVSDVNATAKKLTQVDGVGVTDESRGFRALRQQTLIMAESEAMNQDISLTDLEDCMVKLLGPPSAVRMNNLKNCTILSAPVSTAIFIDDCKNCTFVLACQQLRVHTTMCCKFYLHVTSRAIVEDCSDIGFAPFNLGYDRIDGHFKMAGINPNENNWSLVNDFNWLRRDEHSPNWFIINESERVSCWTF